MNTWISESKPKDIIIKNVQLMTQIPHTVGAKIIQYIKAIHYFCGRPQSIPLFEKWHFWLNPVKKFILENILWILEGKFYLNNYR